MYVPFDTLLFTWLPAATAWTEIIKNIVSIVAFLLTIRALMVKPKDRIIEKIKEMDGHEELSEH